MSAKKIVANRNVQVILLERVKNLGNKYQTIEVKPVYAAHVLIPNGVALLATPKNINDLKHKIAKHQAEKAEYVASLEDLVSKINKNEGLAIKRQANEKQVLFDKVDAKDIAHEIKSQYSFDIHEDDIQIPHRFDAIGTYHASILMGDKKFDIPVDIQVQEVHHKG